jgi:hypothetical protein
MIDLDQLFAAIAGRRIPGGCDCDSYQTMTKQYGIHVITVHHDDDCPTWLQHQAITRREATS